jgi:hypothetical protein
MTYHYSRPSAVLGADVALATSGGVSPGGLLESPRFFSGFLGHAEQAAVALRLCARIARTRFYVPPGMIAAVLPYERGALETMHRRLRDARALADDGAVTLTADGALVGGHRVTRTANGVISTCPWWGKHRGGRGACKHVLAAEMAGLR